MQTLVRFYVQGSSTEALSAFMPAIPRHGDFVQIKGTRYQVAEVTWLLNEDQDDEVCVLLK